MVELALITLFVTGAIAAVTILADSAVRGFSAHRRLRSQGTSKAFNAPSASSSVSIVRIGGEARPALRLVSQEGLRRPAEHAPVDQPLRAAA